MEGAGVVPEALGETVLRVAEVEVAGVDEVHWSVKRSLWLKMVVGAG